MMKLSDLCLTALSLHTRLSQTPFMDRQGQGPPPFAICLLPHVRRPLDETLSSTLKGSPKVNLVETWSTEIQTQSSLSFQRKMWENPFVWALHVETVYPNRCEDLIKLLMKRHSIRSSSFVGSVMWG